MHVAYVFYVGVQLVLHDGRMKDYLILTGVILCVMWRHSDAYLERTSYAIPSFLALTL